MVVKVKDNGFQDVPLMPWPIKIDLNSDQIHLAITQNASSYHHRTTAKWNGCLDVDGSLGDIWLPSNTSSSFSHLQKKVAFIEPMNLSPQCKIPPVVYQTPYQNGALCAGVRRGCLTGLLARYPAVFSRFLTVLIEMALLGIQLSLNMMLLEKGAMLN